MMRLTIFLNKKNLILTLFLLTSFIVLKLYSISFESMPYNVDVLAIFLIFAILSVLREKTSLTLIYITWFIILIFYSPSIDPLSSPDALKYYKEAFLDGYYKTKGFYDIINGHLPVIETTAGIIKLISFSFSSNSLVLIVSLNVIILIESSYIFVNLLRLKFKISNLAYYSSLLALCFSPAILNLSFILQKDIYVYFLSIIFLYLFDRLINKKNISTFILIAITVLIGTLIRLYYPLIIVCYLSLLFYNSKVIIRFAVTLFILYFLFFILFLKSSIVDIFFGIASITSTPNFLRSINWEEHPLMTIESCLISFFIALSLLKVIQYRRFLFTFIFIMLFAGATLVGVSQNRVISDSNFTQTSSLLSDNMTRKKVPYVPLLITFIVISFSITNQRTKNHG